MSAQDDTRHRCAVDPRIACPAMLPFHQLMCAAHWRHVPRPTQAMVLATWRHGTHSDYMAAREAAILAVVAKLNPPKLGPADIVLINGPVPE